jgi:hypothetical protein
VEELQMDWLRSEDLKEEKVTTTSCPIVAGSEPKEILAEVIKEMAEPRVATSARR